MGNVWSYIYCSISSEASILVLLHELCDNRWDTKGLSKVRIVGKGFLLLPVGDIFCYRWHSETHHLGVGFLVHTATVGNRVEFYSII